MKSNNLFIIIIITVFCISCNDGNNSFQPQAKEGSETYSIDDFELLSFEQRTNYAVWLEMNHTNDEIGVFKVADSLVFKEPEFDYPYYFHLEDGKFEVMNHGEFGGTFNFIPSDKTKDTIRILNTNVISIFKFKGDIYILQGIAHMSDRGGLMSKLTRKGNKFQVDSIIGLSSAPQAMTISNDRIIIAGHKNLTVFKNFELETSIETFWQGLYPNSVVIVNDDDMYIGFRGGYGKFSLNKKSIDYYKLKSIKNGT